MQNAKRAKLDHVNLTNKMHHIQQIRLIPTTSKSKGRYKGLKMYIHIYSPNMHINL